MVYKHASCAAAVHHHTHRKYSTNAAAIAAKAQHIALSTDGIFRLPERTQAVVRQPAA